jgi:hypothetical protein
VVGVTGSINSTCVAKLGRPVLNENQLPPASKLLKTPERRVAT